MGSALASGNIGQQGRRACGSLRSRAENSGSRRFVANARLALGKNTLVVRSPVTEEGGHAAASITRHPVHGQHGSDGRVLSRRPGFKLKSNDEGWKTLDAGNCEIALHSGGRKPGPGSPKLQFDVKDVAAARTALIARGTKMGKVSSKDGLDLCGGKDPDGNPFSLSNRGK
jgi:hypothetical protein